MSEAPDSLRVDKWLWHARFFKTRALCAALIKGGNLRLNEQRVAKPATAVKTGDLLVFPQAKQLLVIRVLGIGTRRGPAPEAQTLYEDLTPPAPKESRVANPRFDGKGRPNRKDRAAMRAFSPDGLE